MASVGTWKDEYPKHVNLSIFSKFVHVFWHRLVEEDPYRYTAYKTATALLVRPSL